MTPREFSDWMADFTARLPRKAASLSAAGHQTTQSWREVLEGVELADALEANRELQAGDLRVPFDWDEIPARVRSFCRQKKSERNVGKIEQPHVEHGEQDGIAPHPGFRAALAELLADPKRPGESKAERYKRHESIVNRHLDVVDEQTPPAGQVRTRCDRCDGTGLVYVWHNEMVRRVSRDKPAKQITSGVACSCVLGDLYAETRKLGSRETVSNKRYNSWGFCRTSEDVASWLETRKPPNYEPSFDDFNRQGVLVQ